MAQPCVTTELRSVTLVISSIGAKAWGFPKKLRMWSVTVVFLMQDWPKYHYSACLWACARCERKSWLPPWHNKTWLFPFVMALLVSLAVTQASLRTITRSVLVFVSPSQCPHCVPCWKKVVLMTKLCPVVVHLFTWVLSKHYQGLSFILCSKMENITGFSIKILMWHVPMTMPMPTHSKSEQPPKKHGQVNNSRFSWALMWMALYSCCWYSLCNCFRNARSSSWMKSVLQAIQVFWQKPL